MYLNIINCTTLSKNNKRQSNPSRIVKMFDKARDNCFELIENDSYMLSRKFSVIIRDKI